jgi:diguanylate cyclase (GGDEF)-like protein
MSASTIILRSLIIIVGGFAAAAVYLVDVDRHGIAAIANSARYSLAWSCAQARAEVTNLGQAVGRYAIDRSPTLLKEVRMKHEIVAGRADSFGAGEYLVLAQRDPVIAKLIDQYRVMANVADNNFVAWVKSGQLLAAESHVSAMQTAIEPLCTSLREQSAISIEESQESLKSAHTAAITLMICLIVAGLLLISILFYQNRIVVRAYAQQREIAAQHEYMANHDVLTGLPNRGMFFRSVEDQMAMTQSASSVAVMTIDLDRFKLINDTLGHQAGDKLLKSVAIRLGEMKGEGVLTSVARLGGDEFIASIASTDETAEALRAAQAIVDKIGLPHSLDDHSVVVNATVGIALSDATTIGALELARRSDVALGYAKARKRGTWSMFDEQMDEGLRNRRALELDMRTALERGEFELQYQPFVDLKSGDIRGVEALIRWNHPRYGLISPATFIPIAEESGLIVAIGRFALLRACQDALQMPKTWTVAANLSAVQFLRDDPIMAVSEALAVTGFDPHRLELEITESVMLGDEQNVHAIIDGLQALGVRVALDDFGTGYSSLSYLRRFGFNKMKIDQSFVRAAIEDPEGLALIRAIVGLGHTLGLEVTAEGIETQEQRDALREADCQNGQGYFFARPASPSDLLTLPIERCTQETKVLAA